MARIIDLCDLESAPLEERIASLYRFDPQPYMDLPGRRPDNSRPRNAIVRRNLGTIELWPGRAHQEGNQQRAKSLVGTINSELAALDPGFRPTSTQTDRRYQTLKFLAENALAGAKADFGDAVQDAGHAIGPEGPLRLGTEPAKLRRLYLTKHVNAALGSDDQARPLEMGPERLALEVIATMAPPGIQNELGSAGPNFAL